jgi:hypothetical protein
VVANLLCVRTPNATVNLTLKNGAAFDGPVLGGYQTSDESWGRRVDFGPLLYGQIRDLVVPVKLPAGYAPDALFVEAQLVFSDRTGEVYTVKSSSNKQSSSIESRIAIWKHRAVDLGHAALKLAVINSGVSKAVKGHGGYIDWFAATQIEGASGTNIVAGHRIFEELIKAMKAQDDLQGQKSFAALIGDVGGRATKALTEDRRLKRS